MIQARLLLLFAVVAVGLSAQSPLQLWASSLAEAGRKAQAGDAAGAEAAYRRAIEAAEGMDDNRERLAIAFNNFGSFLLRSERYEEAETKLRVAAALFGIERGRQSKQALNAQSNLGSLYLHWRKLGKARERFEMVQAGLFQILGADHPDLAKAHINLAQTFQLDGKTYAAHGEYLMALEILANHRPAQQKQFDRAFGMAAAMLHSKIRVAPVQGASTAARNSVVLLDRAAELHATFGDGPDAELLARRSIHVRRSLAGSKSPAVWRGLIYLARSLTSQRRFDEADEALDEALGLVRAEDALDRVAEVPILKEAAEVAEARGDAGAVEKILLDIVEIEHEMIGEGPADLRESLKRAADVLGRMGDDEAAERLLALRENYAPSATERYGEDSDLVEPLRVVKQFSPEYPEEAFDLAYEATVKAWAVIDENGAVTNLHVYECAGHGMDRAALRAFRLWRFEPRRVEGKAVPAFTTMQVNFQFNTGR